MRLADDGIHLWSWDAAREAVARETPMSDAATVRSSPIVPAPIGVSLPPSSPLARPAHHPATPGSAAKRDASATNGSRSTQTPLKIAFAAVVSVVSTDSGVCHFDTTLRALDAMY